MGYFWRKFFGNIFIISGKVKVYEYVWIKLKVMINILKS